MSNNIFLHDELYRGQDIFHKLAKPEILICGIGALGSNLADNLCRQGITNLSVVDDDRIELHNINTQVWTSNDVGALKSATIANHIYNVTGQDILQSNKRVDARTIKKLAKNAHILVDCFDNTESRQILYDYASKEGVACLHIGLFEDYGEVVWNEDYKVPQQQSEESDLCDYPLARNIAMLASVVATEEIIRYILGEQTNSWAITLKDLKISKY